MFVVTKQKEKAKKADYKGDHDQLIEQIKQDRKYAKKVQNKNIFLVNEFIFSHQ